MTMRTTRAAERSKSVTQLESTPTDHGLAVTPPAYGIDFLDATENRTGMPDRLKAGLEQLSGLDLSAVRVHYNSSKPAPIHALAFAQGTSIHLGPGQEKHLPHEGWHVVQQLQGRVSPTIQAKGASINDDPSLELEADAMGERALRMQRRSPIARDREGAVSNAGPPTWQPTPKPATARTLNLVQRLAVKENPVDASKLTSIRELKGGHKGKVYLLEAATGQKLVVKLQKEDPSEALVGTGIMKHAGAVTPDLRVADKQDVQKIIEGLAKLDVHETAQAFASDSQRYPHVLLMGFAEGRTIKAMMDDAPLEMIQALKSRNFLTTLGTMMAADTFAGNPDRMMAIKLFHEKGPRGWFHEQNTMIAKTSKAKSYTAVAIDNAFSPWIGPAVEPWGRYESFGLQRTSVAAANPKYFKIEAELVFDRIVEEITKRHKKDATARSQVTRLMRAKHHYVAYIVDAAERAMAVLMNPDQDWTTTKLSEMAHPGEVCAEDLAYFKERERYMRLVRAGVEPKKALDIAKDDVKYQQYKQSSL